MSYRSARYHRPTVRQRTKSGLRHDVGPYKLYPIDWAAFGWAAFGWAAFGWVAIDWAAFGWAAFGWVAHDLVASTDRGRNTP